MPITRERRFAPRTDHLLAARVAAELDNSVAHGRGIQVFAANDWITLRGIALRDELSKVIETVRKVKGVKGLTNNLEIRSAPGKVFALQS
jgi:Predicted periplasmic or secreted lipoprotein